jgi:hypothetical protein
MTLEADQLKFWIPYKLAGKGGDVVCEWLYVGDKPFEEPFFDETINICKRFPDNQKRQKNVTPVPALREWSKSVEAAQPAAFVFHVSRCGSTMVSQLLTTRKDLVVLSEVPFFDEVLRSALHGFENATLFAEALKYYSQERTGFEKSVFIKLDSWHIFFQKEIRAMFPDTPFILLYRSPDEVVRSLNKAPGMHCIPQFIDPEFFGIKEPIITSTDFYNYPVKVIEKYLQGYIDVMESDSKAYLLNYNQGMLSIIKDTGIITGIGFSEDDLQKMKERLLFHSKYPGTYFSEEPIQGNRDERFLMAFELYDHLEKLRMERNETSF